MTRVVSITCHTGAVKIRTQDKVGDVEGGESDNWSEVDERLLQSGESATSITLTDTRRLLVEEVKAE